MQEKGEQEKLVNIFNMEEEEVERDAYGGIGANVKMCKCEKSVNFKKISSTKVTNGCRVLVGLIGDLVWLQPLLVCHLRYKR